MTTEPLPSIDGGPECGTPRILFTTHCARLSGAEFILCDLVGDFFRNSEIFLFEDGPLRLHMEATGLPTAVGRQLNDLLDIRRDGALRVDLPFLRAMSRAVLQLARRARKHKLVYANSQKAFAAAAFAAPLAKRPLIWHLHDIMTREHFGAKQIRIAIGLANRAAARVIVPSQAVGEAFCAAGGQRNKVRVVRNGISIPAGTRSLDRDRLRVELGLPPGFLIAAVGRLAPWKGQHVMLEDALGLRGRVRFLGHRTDVPRLMRASDIVVHTSVDPEPSARVIVEAMLSGTPVAATHAGGVPEILTGGLSALLYPPGDPTGLANLLQSFQSGVYCRTRLVEEGIERAERFYSVRRMQRDVNSIILEILGTRQ